ncbi:MAG: LPS assembly lipoprotein LptE [Balneolaceae bacterium]
MTFNKQILTGLLVCMVLVTGCMTYSFTGTSIPPDVRTLYIPFIPDRSESGLGDLSDRLNQALINRFINQSRLSLANDQESADSYLEGSIQSYQNRPFSVGGDQQANLNEVRITVRATFQFAKDEKPLWSKSFTGNSTYDVRQNPLDAEIEAAEEVLQQIANNMFNDAVGNW